MLNRKGRKRKSSVGVAGGDLAIASIPTPMRMIKAGVDIDRGNAGGRITMRDSPLERAHKNRWIDDRAYGAGVKFRLHWHRGGMAGSIGTIDLGAPSFGSSGFGGLTSGEIGQHHRNQFWRACKELGRAKADFMEKAVCFEEPLEQLGYVLGWGNRTQAITGAGQLMITCLGILVEKLEWP